jgi:aryl-alcohol dehydrogenase-like predicted oxidoreductase
MIAPARLGLGTAQFGADYGVSNSLGRPSEAEIVAILDRAATAGFGYLDAAPSYGEAESLVGRHLPEAHDFRIVSKTLPIADDAIAAQQRCAIVDGIEVSCERLRVGRLYGVLVHRAADIRKKGWQYIVDGLNDAKSRGLVERIGVSVYDADDLSLLESRFRPDIVQLPCNFLDRRLIDAGWLDRLKASGAEIHARSIFLQGLLLMPPADIADYFAPVREAIADLQARWRSRGLTPLAGCLGFVAQQPQIDAIIVGVNRRVEIEDIEAALAQASASEADFGDEPPIDARYVDPRRWPSLVAEPAQAARD